MELAEYSRLDGLALAGLVAAGEVTPQELATLALAAADRVNPVLGAVVETWPDAIDRADAPVGPYAGVPTMLKDLFHGAIGRTCENGSRMAEGWITAAGAASLSRMRAAGFVEVGRTTTSEFGILGSTETLACGPTCTPWSADHMAGGSSGGAGAVVGAGIVPVATASDGGGSIRIPAAACGVVGLKPTRGRVTWGPGGGDALGGWAVKFVTTRSVRDSAATLDVLAGPLPGDPSIAPHPGIPFLSGLDVPTGPLRIAFCHAGWSGRPVHPEVAAACEATAVLLTSLGHEVEAAAPPFVWEPFLDAMTAIWSADTAHTIDRLAPFTSRGPGPDTLEGPTLAMLVHGRAVSAQTLLDAHDFVNALARDMGSFFTAWDVLLTPTLGTLPWRLGVYDPHADVAPRELFDTWSELEGFLPAFNATGQPAISLPLYQSDVGLPIGMQLVGRFGDEATLLALSAQLEAALPWAERLPPIHAGR